MNSLYHGFFFFRKYSQQMFLKVKYRECLWVHFRPVFKIFHIFRLHDLYSVALRPELDHVLSVKQSGHVIVRKIIMRPCTQHSNCKGHYNDVIMSAMASHQPHDCLLQRLIRRWSKKTTKPRITGLCAGNSPVTGEFPALRANNAENVAIWWRHHVNHYSYSELTNTPRLAPTDNL